MAWTIRAAACVVVCVVALAVTSVFALVAPGRAVAAVSTYPQGIPGSPFLLVTPLSEDVVMSGEDDQTVSLKVGALQVLDAHAAGYAALGVLRSDPRSVQALGNGGMLVADGQNRLVAEFDAAGALVWSYGAGDDPDVITPVCAQRLNDGRTLIVDGQAARVFIVTGDGRTEWQYGITGEPGAGAGRLDGPTSAEVVAGGNVAICDAGNHRVIVVRASDYDAAAPDAGFTADSIVWQYGTTGVSGDGVDELVTPTSLRCLIAGGSRGNMLICDAGADRVLEVRASDFDATAPSHGFTAKSIVWRFPKAGSTAVSLENPGCALGSNGSDNIVWIADTGSGRVLGVATGSISGRPTRHQVFAVYGASSATPPEGSLSAPVALSQARDGRLLVADQGARRVVAVGTTSDVGSVHSALFDCGLTRRKRFASLTCAFARVPLAPIAVSYRIDRGSWQLLGRFGGGADMSAGSGIKTVPFPPLTVGRRIAYQITLSTGSRACAPALESLTIAYEPWTSSSDGSGGGGDGGDRRDSSGGSGIYRYPATSAGAGSGSGGGEGGGEGSGSGAGAGSGRGTGDSGGLAGSATGAVGAGASGAEAPAELSQSNGGAGGTTSRVSGYIMRAAGTAGGGEGGGEDTPSGRSPIVWASGLLFAVVLMASPGLIERRRLRMFKGWGLDTPRPYPAERTRRRPRSDAAR